MSKCLPMLQPVHEESSSTVSPAQQLGPHVLEREGKPMHSDDSPIRPDGCLSSPKFQRLFKTYLPIKKVLDWVFKIYNSPFYSIIHLFFDYCIYILLCQEKRQFLNYLMQDQMIEEEQIYDVELSTCSYPYR